MRKLIMIAAASFLLANTAFAASCAERAIDKHGKPLRGAAKNAFIKKCEKHAAPAHAACAAKAIGKNGKALKGAAKTAFIKKCEAGAKR